MKWSTVKSKLFKVYTINLYISIGEQHEQYLNRNPKGIRRS